MATTAQLIRGWSGPALLAGGFRPFFLMGAVWAGFAMIWWLLMLAGRAPMPGVLMGADWHAHAMIFGYGGAVVAGFLLTAIPNWTGRLPVAGGPLAGLAGLWLAGRIATTAAVAAPVVVAVLDLAMPVVLLALMAREIATGKNWRNLPVLGICGLFAAGQALFHIHGPGAAQGAGLRLSLAALVMLMALIGGRIIPSFTRNWLVKQGGASLPAPMDRLDKAALIVTAVALIAFVAWPGGAAVPLALAGAALLARLSRWRGWATRSQPLLWVLHLGYAWVALGFFTAAAAGAGLMAASGALHGWMAGAVGVMTLAVMARASLGHTGRDLAAGPGLVGVFAAINIAALLRVAAAIWPGAVGLLHAAGTAWIIAFAGFALMFWPVLTRPRLASRG
ncbi:NnrS family protein [Paracoccus sp. (in: a-proteobacteria)]|uniref:NnrS family protein n=1 Tax=Paracoccus sp. TaxID=267 RepID=UPI0026DF4B0F|nr:NnrS family protein [Paracoccus sp. (in: a-proteobacteria)]MDO5647866.1 NnrS family protein [Paracoccus sp. (in: a-proteobacteria)]